MVLHLGNAVVETVIERQRWYLVTGWSSTLLFSDPPQWSDEHDNPKTREEFELPDENGEEWRWTSDWIVYVDEGNEQEEVGNTDAKHRSPTVSQLRPKGAPADLDADHATTGQGAPAVDSSNKSSTELAFECLTDANGWVYATSFTTARNWTSTANSGLKIVRLRRWVRTRAKRDLRAELAMAHSPARRPEFSQEELSVAEKLLSKYDANHDGLLDKTDLVRLLKEEKGLDEVFGPLKAPVMTRQTSADDPTICTVCYVGKVNCCIIPCGHHVLCMSCAQDCMKKENQCPVCRKDVQQLVQTYNT
eukprot:TRINITY_DN13572_c0_g1_i1.p1 TRINITY_DN13572_c0_g1~~TRINITY_DN13572_c0_g1_i1.p1  ORF type:complete len:305 (-),score=70.01 TRINITY_DN13572_c0_g1_i1:44-958(-)